ncbi:hypothetical protein CJ177_41380 [Rhodococcus sp. ACPA1]|nr:hypothetical protein CJ177_41380 [Rhodococcus sp. ACPA1]
MVADHLAPKYRPMVSGREVFAVPAGTAALRKTVDCLIEIDRCAIESPVTDRARMRGSDRGRVRALAEVSADPDYRSWLSMHEQRRRRGRDALLLLVQEQQTRARQQR